MWWESKNQHGGGGPCTYHALAFQRSEIITAKADNNNVTQHCKTLTCCSFFATLHPCQ